MDKKRLQKELNEGGLAKDKQYIYDTAAQAERGKTSKKGQNLTFGWDVFNDDTLYRSYFKRTKNLDKLDKTLTEDERIALMADDVQQ